MEFGRDLWKCPAQSPAQSRVTSKLDQVAQGLVSPNFEAFQARGQLISTNYTLKQWTVFSYKFFIATSAAACAQTVSLLAQPGSRLSTTTP